MTTFRDARFDRRSALKTGALASALMAGGGFATGALAQDDDGRGDIDIVIVSHGQASDPFWSVVQNGSAQAGTDMRVNVQYQAPSTFDMVAMSQLIDAAVATNPTGLVVSIPDADALSGAITAAIEAGIPVISMNSGSDVAKELGILIHVGQTEYEAGYGGGQRMAEAGGNNALCVNQEVGNAALDIRCQGFTDAMTEAGGTVEVLAVDLADPTGSQQRISGALDSNGDIDSILTLGPTGAAPALACSDRIGPTWRDSARDLRPFTGSARSGRRLATCSLQSINSSTSRDTCRSCCSRC